MTATANDAIMQRVTAHGSIIGFTMFGVRYVAARASLADGRSLSQTAGCVRTLFSRNECFISTGIVIGCYRERPTGKKNPEDEMCVISSVSHFPANCDRDGVRGRRDRNGRVMGV
jgi:hypothetical protein